MNPNPRLNSVVLAALLIAACFLTVTPRSVFGQDETAPVTVADVNARLESLPEGEDTARDLYNQALAQLERASVARNRAADAQRKTEEAQPLLESIRKELARPAGNPAPNAPADATLTQLEQGLNGAIAELDAARSLVNELASEASKRQTRRAEIPDIRARLNQQLEELNNALATPISEPAAPSDFARHTLLRAEHQAVEAELNSLNAELASYDARQDLLPARRDRATRRVTDGEKLVAAWQQLVSTRRKADAEAAARVAKEAEQQTVVRQHPTLQEFAATNQRLAEIRTHEQSIPQRISTATRNLSSARTKLADLRRQYTTVHRRINTSGLTGATGLLLRRQFESLPNVSAIKRRIAETKQAIEDVEYTLIERQEARADAGDIDLVTRQLLIGADEMGDIQHADDIAAAHANLENIVRELATARRDLLNELVNDATRYMETLYELDGVNHDLVEATDAYDAYIRERILWVKSISSSRQESIDNIASASGKSSDTFLTDSQKTLTWFINPTAWKENITLTGKSMLNDLNTSIPGTLLIIVIVAAGILSRKRINHFADLVSRHRTDKLRYSFWTLVLTFAAALPTPSVLWFLGWVLQHPVSQTDHAAAMGYGLQSAALLVIPLVVMMQMIRTRGLAESHFRWPVSALAPLRWHLRWMIPTVIPLIFMLRALDRGPDEAALATIGRLMFTALMVILAVFLHRMIYARDKILASYFGNQNNEWLVRFAALAQFVVPLIPLILVALAWAGYFYTARQLGTRVVYTIAFLLGLIIVNGLLARWLNVTRRRVAIEEAKRRRDLAKAESASAAPDGPSESASPNVDEDAVDLPAISLQTRQLFRAAIIVTLVLGLYSIWTDVLPALRILDRVEIYPTPRVVDAYDHEPIPILETDTAAVVTPDVKTNGTTESTTKSTQVSPAGPMSMAGTDSDSAEEDAPVEALSITLADVGLALVLFIVTVIAFRNIPGLIEISVLQRLPIDAASRYALSTVIRYLIAIVGVAAGLSAIGMTWGRVQWLAAALTFGLAFGLQEIFANFVSGLIILAERPIRIGDTVTVGGVSGSVTRIRMRATTITDWDRKELVIPNKTFITGEVINWTLSDPILRLTVVVGVSYSADVREVDARLMKIAERHPNIMSDPPPYVVFNQFGDNSLNFELRVFIPNFDHRIAVQKDLHMSIIEDFRKAGIEIAFPQRDLHIKSLPDLKLIKNGIDDEAPDAKSNTPDKNSPTT